jgi:tRNA A37 threonylcarbamoyladenosine biosynthesis protein TsaE
MQSGLIHELEKTGVHFIEWAGEDLREFIRDAGFETALIKIESHGDIREYTIDAT